MRVASRIVVVSILLAASPAQAANGSIQCRVVDQEGRPLDGTCIATLGSTRLTCATAGGRCTISEVPPGTYQVTVTPVSGTAPAASTVPVGSGSSATAILRVTLGGSTPTIVAAPRPVQVMAGRVDAGAGAGAGADGGRDAGDGRAGDGSSVCNPSAGSDGGTTSGSGGAPCVPAPDASAADARSTDAAVAMVRPLVGVSTASPSPPDRSTGTFLSIQGRTSDSRGRPIDGTVTASQGGVEIAYAATVAGRYTLYDLPQGDLSLVFRPVSGSPVTRTVRYSGDTLTANFSAAPAP